MFDCWARESLRPCASAPIAPRSSHPRLPRGFYQVGAFWRDLGGTQCASLSPASPSQGSSPFRAAQKGDKGDKGDQGPPGLKARKVLRGRLVHQARLARMQPARASGSLVTRRKPRAAPTRSWPAPIAPAEPPRTSRERLARAVTAGRPDRQRRPHSFTRRRHRLASLRKTGERRAPKQKGRLALCLAWLQRGRPIWPEKSPASVPARAYAAGQRDAPGWGQKRRARPNERGRRRIVPGVLRAKLTASSLSA